MVKLWTFFWQNCTFTVLYKFDVAEGLKTNFVVGIKKKLFDVLVVISISIGRER